MSSNLDITQLKFEQNEIGNLIKASKALFSWEFVLDGNRQKIELQHSRIKGKRIVIFNGKEVSNSMQYTYSFSYSFPIDKHYLTIIQISPDQYDLRIDNISFISLLNRQKIDGYSVNKKKENKTSNSNNNDDFFSAEAGNDFNFDEKVFEKNQDLDFDFSGGETKKSSLTKENQQNTQKESNLLDFGFDGNTQHVQSQQNNNQPQQQSTQTQNLTFNFLKTTSTKPQGTNNNIVPQQENNNLFFDTLNATSSVQTNSNNTIPANNNNNNVLNFDFNSINQNTTNIQVTNQNGMFDFNMQSNLNTNSNQQSKQGNNPFDFTF